jgi:hypothetical protein
MRIYTYAFHTHLYTVLYMSLAECQDYKELASSEGNQPIFRPYYLAHSLRGRWIKDWES